MYSVLLSLGSPRNFPVLHEGHEIIRGLPIDDRMSQNSNIYINCILKFPDPKSVTNRVTSITITAEIQRGTPSNIAY